MTYILTNDRSYVSIHQKPKDHDVYERSFVNAITKLLTTIKTILSC